MNTINNLPSTTNPGLGINNQNPISCIPQDMIELILQNTNDMQKQQASFVSKLWCASSINAAKNQEFLPINVCLELLLQDYYTENNAIVEALKETKIENLQQVKTKTDDLREKILNILKNMASLTLLKLCKSASNLSLKNNLFAIAKMYQEIDLLEKHPLADIKIHYKLSTLIELGQFSKVVEVAFNKFSAENYKKGVISELTLKSSSLATYRKIKTVTQILENLIKDKDDENLKSFLSSQSFLLVNIFNLTAKTDDFVTQYPALVNMLGALLNYKESLNLPIKEISSTFAKSLTSTLLTDIAIALLEQEKNDEALKVALEIQDPSLKESTLAKIQGPSLNNCIVM